MPKASSSLGADPAYDYDRIARAIHFLSAHFLTQPDLGEVARRVHLSPYHFQRLFTRWAGVSPKRFVQYLTVEYAKERLQGTRDLLSVSMDVGLSSPGRLHDLFVAAEAITPGDFKRRGAGLTVTWGEYPSPFGRCMLAKTERGVCGLWFVDSPAQEKEALQELDAKLPAAELKEDPAAIQVLGERIFAAGPVFREPLALHLVGTNFQLQVWQALLRVAPGGLASYHDIAALIDQPSASRAVGTAIGKNSLAYLIPCHRVIKKTGELGDYRWGTERKRALLGWEAARLELPQTA